MIETLRNTISHGLYKFTGRLVVETDTNAEKPKRPFLSYKFTITRMNVGEGGVRGHRFDTSNDPKFKHDYIESLEFQPYSVISIQAHADSVLESQTLALQAWEWFKLMGDMPFEDVNAVVVDVGNITDRSVYLVDGFEFKQGFDVRIRWLHHFENRIPNIEQFTINGKVHKTKFAQDFDTNEIKGE